MAPATPSLQRVRRNPCWTNQAYSGVYPEDQKRVVQIDGYYVATVGERANSRWSGMSNGKVIRKMMPNN